ncbi:MAG: NAD(P)H-dependent oxidoreductase [Acidobacteriota bacterium]
MTKALLLAGSPRHTNTSQVLGQAILDALAANGFACETIRLTGLLDTQEGRARLLGAYLGADLVVLAAPVYVDAPPAAVMRALEFLAGEDTPQDRVRRLCAVFNCGFPEAEHTALSLDVCRLFAKRAGLQWAGGIGVGAGGAVNGQPLEARGRVTRPLRRALALAGDALARGLPIPQEAVDLAARPLLPAWLYLLMAQTGWLAQAWKRRTLFRLDARPFASGSRTNTTTNRTSKIP